jgi:hypothetical protein
MSKRTVKFIVRETFYKSVKSNQNLRLGSSILEKIASWRLKVLKKVN